MGKLMQRFKHDIYDGYNDNDVIKKQGRTRLGPSRNEGLLLVHARRLILFANYLHLY